MEHGELLNYIHQSEFLLTKVRFVLLMSKQCWFYWSCSCDILP